MTDTDRDPRELPRTPDCPECGHPAGWHAPQEGGRHGTGLGGPFCPCRRSVLAVRTVAMINERAELPR